jgi:hypothetical protein
MKKVLLAALAITGVLTAVVAYERVFVERSFGPSVILSLAPVGSLFVTLLITILLAGTGAYQGGEPPLLQLRHALDSCRSPSDGRKG